MSDREEVLFANEAFYVSFAGGDVAAMEDLWARTAIVACIHPGWEPIHGREPVLASWRAIMRAGAPEIRCRAPEVTVHGAVAMVICYEEVQGNFLIATNLFVRENGAWRMVHHQAGPTRGAPPADQPDGGKRSIN